MPDNNITVLKRGDKNYPELLAQISDPPKTLYCRGNIALLGSPCIGVVGTRAMTPYGRQAAQTIAYELAANGMTVVSGLAMGIDAVAHQAALDAGGSTVAVLGTGIENIAPQTNFRLAQNILKNNGLIISEYEGMTDGTKYTFPMRNRIVSGLSRGIIVIEADKRSGALITAQCALDQNRDVFAVPGSIFSPRSAGTNLLLQQGAKAVLSAADILQEYELSTFNFELSAPVISTKDDVQKKILAILTTNGPAHIDALIAESGIEAARISAAIAHLEIGNIIINTGNGTYRIRT